MKRMAVLKIVNPIFGLLLMVQVLTGLCGGLLPHDWFVLLHEAGGLACAVAAMIHVILNWNWIKSTYTRKASSTG